MKPKPNAESSHARIIRQYQFDGMKRAEAELARQYGERYQTYREQFVAAGEMRYEPPFPLYIMMEQTYRCNLRCVSCIHGYPEERRRFDMDERVMPWELYERVVLEGEEHGCPSISTHNNDEPLLVKDLPERIAFAREHGFMEVIMTTNAMLLNTEKIKQVIEAGVTRILFSIDAATAETYDKVRPGGNFDQVCESLKETVAYRKTLGGALPIIRASFVPNRINQHEMELFFERFADLVDYIDIQPFCGYGEMNRTLIPDGAKRIEDFRCNSPWRYMIVRADGQVLPCPNFQGAEVPVGNLDEESLYDIFNGPRMKTLRQEFKEGVYSNAVCQDCASDFWLLPLE